MWMLLMIWAKVVRVIYPGVGLRKVTRPRISVGRIAAEFLEVVGIAPG
jgi:hypothetical protein